jgi:hypothetical protein
MASKQSLKIREPNSHDILKVALSTSSSINASFYRDEMGENQQKSSFHNFPTTVHAQRIGWILNDFRIEECKNPLCDLDHLQSGSISFGQNFLIQLLEKGSNELLVVPAVRVLIEYLFNVYKDCVVWKTLPMYLV